MSTSGSWDFSATAAQIMASAAVDLGIIQPGGTISTGISAEMLKRLNFIVKQWQGKADMAQGLKIHTRQRVTVFLAKNQQTYLVGPAASDNHATTQFGITTLTAAKAAGQTVMAITANSDTTNYPGTTYSMTNGDYVGVVQSDGTLFWTTITANGSTSLTLTAALTVAANNGAKVYWYTSKAQRFPIMEFGSLRNADRVDVPLPPFQEVADYEALTNKSQTGDPIRLLIEPLRLNTRVTSDFLPQDVTKQLRLTVLYPAEDYDATTDDVAFPQEWYAALEWELALRSKPLAAKEWTPDMQLNYTQATAIARELNPQNTTAHFEPNRPDW